MKPRPKLFDSAIPLFNLLERAGISYEQLYERVHQQQTGTQEDRTVSINMKWKHYGVPIDAISCSLGTSCSLSTRFWAVTTISSKASC